MTLSAVRKTEVCQAGKLAIHTLRRHVKHFDAAHVWMQCYFSQEGLKPLNAAGASAEGSFTNIVMSGQDVFRFAVRAVPAVSLLLLHRHSAAPCDTAPTGLHP